MLKLNLSLVAVTTVMASSMMSIAPAQAESHDRFDTHSFRTESYGRQGSNVSGGCIHGSRYGTARGTACGIQGPNGSASRVNGAAAGVGAFRHVNRNYTNPNNGNTVSGAVNSRYNAQTGQGHRYSDRSGTINGRNYDYQTNTNYHYTPGVGVTGNSTIDTLNHGNYNCTYTTGSGRNCAQR